jgi:hypothetical protein
LALALAAPCAFAQLMPSDPDWKEMEVPPPPAVRTSGLIALDMPRSELRFGVDPQSVAIGADGIVRYVVVAQGREGAVNAMYEGIRCSEGKVRQYARSSGGTWQKVDGEWAELREPRFRYAMLVARGGACQEHTPNKSAEQIVRDLRSPAAFRFETDQRR